MQTLLPGQVAWYVTGRFYLDTDNQLADYGFFLQIAGVTGSLFSGPPDVSTAYFTFASQPFDVTNTVTNGTLTLSLDAVGQFSVYLQSTPSANFDDPKTFVTPTCVATFQRTMVVMGTTLGDWPGPGNLFSSNVFSAQLLSSTQFTFGGQQYDFKDMFGAGVTQFGTSAGVGAQQLPTYELIVPFSGSALAVGASQSGV